MTFLHLPAGRAPARPCPATSAGAAPRGEPRLAGWLRPLPLPALAGLLALAPLAAHAQEHAHSDTAGMAQAMEGGMPAGALGLPASRRGSGTAWLPDDSPMGAIHASAGGWSLMVHGNAFLQYLWDGSDRGRDQLGSVNWVMGMAERPLGGGRLELRTMLSAERLTVGECGYPDLLASGEFCDGEPIVDGQHPHDLLMELAAGFERALGEAIALQLYGGLAAEPALGPVAYPHRPSAMANLLAPVTHHWLDASHITFGSVTGGLFGRRWKVEGSVFNGREPDEDRWDLDLARLDSYSGRVSLSPDEHWSVQLSAGHLEEAEVHEPGEPRVDVDRVTASLAHHRTLSPESHWASTLAWGRNSEGEEGRATNALLAESTVTRGGAALFGRVEWVQKSGEDLAVHELHDEVFSLGKLVVGAQSRLARAGSFVVEAGALVSLGVLPDALRPWYGTRAAPGVGVFLRLHPRAMAGMDMGAMEHQPLP